jgi:ferrochelatase
MTIGVLVMAYGGPNNLDEVEPYLLDVRSHRPTERHIIDEVRERYRQIGGRSPILERTQAQAAALQSALDERYGAGQYRTFVGMRHWHPYIEATLAEMAEQGVTHTVGLVMAPHYSRMSIGAYFKKIAAAGSPVAVYPIERWHRLPGYLTALRERVSAALPRFPAEVRATVPVLFTAHSLPERILEWNDPYPGELRETAAALAQTLAPQPTDFAFQSAAMTADPWLGPDAGAVIERLHQAGGRHVLIAPIGFVSDHVEILYDVDIVFKDQAQALGMQLERIEMLNTHPALIRGLAELVHQTAEAALRPEDAHSHATTG